MAAPKTLCIGVGDPITISSTAPATGQILWTGNVSSSQKYTLETVALNWGVPDAQAGQAVFHIFVQDSTGNSMSPFWQYAWLQSQHPEWWQNQMFPIHLPVHGPATITALAVNVSTGPYNLYWSGLVTVDDH